MPFGIGPAELLVVLGAGLLMFGPKQLPKVGRALGQTIRETRDAVDGRHRLAEAEPGERPDEPVA